MSGREAGPWPPCSCREGTRPTATVRAADPGYPFNYPAEAEFDKDLDAQTEREHVAASTPRVREAVRHLNQIGRAMARSGDIGTYEEFRIAATAASMPPDLVDIACDLDRELRELIARNPQVHASWVPLLEALAVFLELQDQRPAQPYATYPRRLYGP